MSTFTRRSSRLATWIAVPAAILAAGLVVSTSSYAAFSSSSSNDGDAWRAGTVRIGDDDTGRALFAAANVKPGDGGTNCITVTSTGSLASDVRLYAANVGGSSGLADQLTLKIEQGTGGGFGSCTGFAAQSTLFDGRLSGFTGAATGYASGLHAWSPTGGGSDARTFRLTWRLVDDAPNSVQGGTASTSFVWEAQNS